MKRPNLPKGLLFLSALICPLWAAGDGRCDDLGYQSWIDYNPSWKASDKWVVFGDVGLRRNYVDPSWWKYVVRPSAAFDFGSWTLGGGLGNFYSDFAGTFHLYELRPWQGARTRWPSSGVKLEHFVRLEERLFFDTDDGNSLFRLRLRYLIGTRVVWTGSGSDRGWNSPFSVEAFFQFEDKAEDRFGEQARISAGVERVFGPKLSLRFDIMWQNTAHLTEFYSDNELYFRLRVFHRL